jgi:hypothetical protein
MTSIATTLVDFAQGDSTVQNPVTSQPRALSAQTPLTSLGLSRQSSVDPINFDKALRLSRTLSAEYLNWDDPCPASRAPVPLEQDVTTIIACRTPDGFPGLNPTGQLVGFFQVTKDNSFTFTPSSLTEQDQRNAFTSSTPQDPKRILRLIDFRNFQEMRAHAQRLWSDNLTNPLQSPEDHR